MLSCHRNRCIGHEEAATVNEVDVSDDEDDGPEEEEENCLAHQRHLHANTSAGSMQKAPESEDAAASRLLLAFNWPSFVRGGGVAAGRSRLCLPLIGV